MVVPAVPHGAKGRDSGTVSDSIHTVKVSDQDSTRADEPSSTGASQSQELWVAFGFKQVRDHATADNQGPGHVTAKTLALPPVEQASMD